MLEDTWHMDFPRRPDMPDGFYLGVNGGVTMWESYPVFATKPKKEENLGLAEAITKSILSAGRIDLQRKLFCSIQLIGGVALTSGLVGVVEERVLHAIPANEAIDTVEVLKLLIGQVLQSRTDPNSVTWKGGAILGVLDFTRDGWIHREDWIHNGIHVGIGHPTITNISSLPEIPSLTITMFSPPIPTAKSLSLPNHTHQKPSHTLLLLNPHSNISNFHPNHHKLLKPISASQLPSPPSSSSSSPHTHHPSQPQSFSPNDLLHILRNRHGHLWHQYALHISTLYHNFSFSGPAVEESTGISCAEQDRLVAAAQVRNSLIAAEVAPKVVSFFDSAAGVHLLYELRLLSDPQLLTVAARQIAARRVENPQTAQDVARAMQDFPQWKGQAFQLALEKNQFANGAELEAGLRRALEVSEAQWLKERVPEFRKADEVWQAVRAHLPVVSIKMGMVENSALVVRMPVCSAEEGEWGVASLPGCQKVGGFGTVTAEKPPGRWVVLPAWKGLVNTGKAGVVVRFKDGSVLPWELGGVFNIEDEILVVVKRGKKAVVREDRFYLVVNSVGGGLRVEKGGRLKDEEVEDRLGIVVLVVRIPAKATAHDLQYLEDTPAEDSDSNAPHFQIPTIDFNGVDSDRRTEIIDEIRQASETWGCFQLVDHGIPISILDNVIEGVRRFHEQPKEAKSDLYTHDIRKEPIPIKEGLANFHRHQLIVGNWRDSLNCVFHIDPLQPEELPEICKYASPIAFANMGIKKHIILLKHCVVLGPSDCREA
ncbi:Actin-like protein arp9 [Asimina triloba]